MRWSERQIALLAEMGIRLWPAPAGAVAPGDDDGAVALTEVASRLVVREAGSSAPSPVGPSSGAVTLPGDAGRKREHAGGQRDQAFDEGRAVAWPAEAPRWAQASAAPAHALLPTAVDPSSLQELPTDGLPTMPTDASAPFADPPVAPMIGSAVTADVRSLDWPALRAAVAGCTACTLCRSRSQTVFGVGHPRAHWMVVGEAPGEQEDREGEPFVGRSGQLLDNMLRAVGVSRRSEEVATPAPLRGRTAPPPSEFASGQADPARCAYIANTLKCRPPGNRNPAPDELARCEAYLIRQIELVQPRIILAMGRFAVQSLLRSSEPIGRLRGRVHRYHGVPLVVTYHPAYLLRNLPEKARAWDDLCLAMDALQTAGTQAPVPTSPAGT